jgi:hypothetical protein
LSALNQKISGDIMHLSQVVLFLCAFLAGPALAQQGGQQGEGQQVTLDKETIDAIAARASPVCRAELEAALEEQAEISTACKEEIHSILLTLSDKFSTAAPDGNEGGAAPAPQGASPVLWIAIFLIIAVVAVAAYAHHVNSVMAEGGDAKVKKALSKKKVSLVYNIISSLFCNVYTNIDIIFRWIR